MKKLLCLTVIMILLLLSGCKPVDTSLQTEDEQHYVAGVWLTYSELDKMLKGDFKNEFKGVVSNCKAQGISDMFVHTVPFCDAYYDSKLLPKRVSSRELDFDILNYMIDLCHENNIKFHAWINPYRVKTADSDVSTLPDGSIAKTWANTQNVSTAVGIYLNPASAQVRALIIDVVREIINNYKVDGIHFDDYFYPTTDELFDKSTYEEYCNNTNSPLPIADFRRANVNSLISGVYTAIKFINKDIIFSVSPSASVDENYNKQYADIITWCENGCVDYIIPQLYFGFEYPDSSFSFDNLLQDWKSRISTTEAKLLIGLAAYKIDTTTEPDRTEWEKGEEIIKRQIEICKTDTEIAGHIYFSYSYMVEKLEP